MQKTSLSGRKPVKQLKHPSEGFVMVPQALFTANIRSTNPLSSNALLILMLLMSFCYRKNQPKVYPSGETLCLMSGISSLNTITKVIKELLEKGWINKELGKIGEYTQFRRNIYDLSPCFARIERAKFEINNSCHEISLIEQETNEDDF